MPGYYGYYYDPTYILVVIGAVLSLFASWRVNATFNKYSKVGNRSGRRAEEIAQFMLNDAGIYDVRIERVNGNLTDHYSPKEKVLRLSDSVYGSTSVAALGVAAHETGHAIQHNRGYVPVKIRSAIVPVVNIGSTLSWPIILAGLIFSAPLLLKAGIILFSLVVIFQFVTLPVEFDASGRAIKILRDRNLLYPDEVSGAKSVLWAAAMTYVAAMISAVLQLLRLVLIFGRRNDD